MKRIAPLTAVLAVFSALAGYLFSKASFAGKAGISLFYRQYRFLKVWWQGALVVFAILFLHLLLQGLIHKKAATRTGKLIHGIFLMMGLSGLYLTYIDFQHTLSHRMLGERFHLGAYLFWMGWIVICLYYLLKRKAATKQ